MGDVAADTSREPLSRRRAMQGLLALLTPLAGVIVALVLAGLFAPWGLFLPLALAVFNVLRLVKGISLNGPAAGRMTLVALNAALVALSIIGLVTA